MTNTLSAIRTILPGLKQAEKRVAETVLLDPKAVISSTITELSEGAEVSEPTVVRFCRKIGLSGYMELRLNLARDLPPEEYSHETIAPQDGLVQIMEKYLRGNQNAVDRALNNIDPNDFQRAVDILAAAERIDFYGYGSPAIVAQDAHFKFFRLGIPCSVHTNATSQFMAATLLNRNSAAVVISNNGSIRDIIQTAQYAREAGATVIGIIGRKRSPLSRACDIVLPFQCNEVAVGIFPFSTRLAQTMLIDVLFLAVVLKNYEKVKDNLERTKRTLLHRSSA